MKGLWSHFFALCTLGILVFLMLSPFTDWNPVWQQPQDHPSYHTTMNEIHGIKGVPIRFIELQSIDKTAIADEVNLPDMYLRPGQTVRLIFANTSSVGVYNITIPKYKMYIVGWNDKPLEQVVVQENVSVLPGKNVHVLFTPTWYDTLLVTAYYHTKGMAKNTQAPILNIRVQGFPMLPSPLPIKLSQ